MVFGHIWSIVCFNCGHASHEPLSDPRSCRGHADPPFVPRRGQGVDPGDCKAVRNTAVGGVQLPVMDPGSLVMGFLFVW